MLKMLRNLLGGAVAPSEPPSRPAPVLIGATGGSGTRAVHGVLSRAGLFMGERLNGAGDAMDFEPWLDDWINPILEVTGRLDYRPEELPDALRARILTAFREALAAYAPSGSGRWGWKNPRSMYMLPLIHSVFPDLHFVHVIRDGRDMALSDNQNQRRKHFAALFGADREGPAASAALWARANLETAAWGERTLGSRYHRVRLEDLCAEPVARTGMLLDALGVSGADVPAAASGLAMPDSVGRWRQAEPPLLAAISAEAEPALRRFGYL
jgi:hypothetical protein